MTLGWVYQYWNDPERERLDAKINDGGKIEPHEIAEINAAGAQGEMLGHFFDARGRVLSSQKMSAESWAGQDVVGAALSVIEDEGAVAVANLYRDFCAQAGK